MAAMVATRFRYRAGQAGRLPLLLWQGLNQLLWPAVCRNCRQDTCADDNDLCQSCWEQLLTCTAGEYCPRCGRDASRYGLVAGACPACQGVEVHFDAIARAGVYADALQQMILSFKHDRLELAPILGSLVDAVFQGSSFQADVEWLVPVPLHWRPGSHPPDQDPAQCRHTGRQSAERQGSLRRSSRSPVRRPSRLPGGRHQDQRRHAQRVRQDPEGGGRREGLRPGPGRSWTKTELAGRTVSTHWSTIKGTAKETLAYLAMKCKDEKPKMKIAESPPCGDDFLNFTFCTLLFDSRRSLC